MRKPMKPMHSKDSVTNSSSPLYRNSVSINFKHVFFFMSIHKTPLSFLITGSRTTFVAFLRLSLTLLHGYEDCWPKDKGGSEDRHPSGRMSKEELVERKRE